MPDFNLLEPAVMAFHEDNLRFWLNRGVDGFRFDAVAHLVENGPDAWYDQPENYALMAPGRARSCTAIRTATWCARRPRNAQRYASAERLRRRLRARLRARRSSPRRSGDAGGDSRACPIISAARRRAWRRMVSNHDLFAGERLWDQVGGDAARYRLAAATYLLQPGTPFVYYGEEIGMSAAPALEGDPQAAHPDELERRSARRRLQPGTPFRRSPATSPRRTSPRAGAGRLLAGLVPRADRAAQRASRVGARQLRGARRCRAQALAFRRRSGDEIAWVVINYDAQAATGVIARAGRGPRGARHFPTAQPAPAVRRTAKLAPRRCPRSRSQVCDLVSAARLTEPNR